MADRQPDLTSTETDQLDVIVPLRTRYASTVRIIAASLGADAGFSVDEIDDVRLALDEVFTLLADEHEGEHVRVTFRLDGGRLSADFALESGPLDVTPDELASNILASVVDRFEFTAERVALVKTASER